MGIITKPYTFASGNAVDGTQINANFDPLYTQVNAATGNITPAAQTVLDDTTVAAMLATLGGAAYSEGTWTPTIDTTFTVVGSQPALSGTWKRIGNLVFVECVISAGSGGNTSVECTSNGSRIAGLPISPTVDAPCMATIQGVAFATAVGFVYTGGELWPATFPAVSSPIYVTAIYPV